MVPVWDQPPFLLFRQCRLDFPAQLWLINIRWDLIEPATPGSLTASIGRSFSQHLCCDLIEAGVNRRRGQFAASDSSSALKRIENSGIGRGHNRRRSRPRRDADSSICYNRFLVFVRGVKFGAKLQTDSILPGLPLALFANRSSAEPRMAPIRLDLSEGAHSASGRGIGFVSLF